MDIIKDINSIGKQIADYNQAIKKIELGSEEANDLRDKRNALLDKLAGYVHIDYSEDKDGVVEVSVEGTQFITRDSMGRDYIPANAKEADENIYIYEGDSKSGMGYKIIDGYVFPYWPKNSIIKGDGEKDLYQFVYDTSLKVSADMNTDVGELKSLIYSRGDLRATYANLDDGGYGILSGDHIDTASSILMNTEAEFDRLIHGVVTKINEVLTGESDTISRGETPVYDSIEDCPLELFVRLGTERYVKDEDPSSENYGKYVYVAENTDNIPYDISTMYSVSNLKINPDILKIPTLLGFINADKSVDYVKGDALAKTFSDTFNVLNPNTTTNYNFVDYYSALVSQLANNGSVYNSILASQQATVTQIDNSRNQIMGVSSNEELTNMIKYQNAYNASSRYINAVSEMLNHIIEKLG